MLSVFLQPLIGRCKAKFCFRLPAFVCWSRGRFDFETFGLWIPKVSKSKQPRGLKCCGIASILVACASQPILAAVCARFAMKKCSSKENVVRVMYVCVCMCVCMCVCVYVLVYANVSVCVCVHVDVRKGLFVCMYAYSCMYVRVCVYASVFLKNPPDRCCTSP